MLDKNQVRQIAADYISVVRGIYNPKQIIMFGSYVDGTPHENSDIDIAVIFDVFDGDWLQAASSLYAIRRPVSLDIEPHLFDERCNRSGFLDHIRKTGEVIYEAHS